MSRKWWALMISTGIVVTVCYTFVAALKIYSSSIVEKGLDVIQVITVAYFGVNFLDKAIEAYKGGQPPGGDGL
jgi:hypothetical protein